MVPDELDPLAPIEVSEHAADRWLTRFGGILDRGRARGEIRTAILERRVARVLPSWARAGDTGRDSPRDRHTHYAWNEAETRCWVLAASASGRIHVQTILARCRTLDERRLRPGLVRR